MADVVTSRETALEADPSPDLEIAAEDHLALDPTREAHLVVEEETADAAEVAEEIPEMEIRIREAGAELQRDVRAAAALLAVTARAAETLALPLDQDHLLARADLSPQGTIRALLLRKAGTLVLLKQLLPMAVK